LGMLLFQAVRYLCLLVKVLLELHPHVPDEGK